MGRPKLVAIISLNTIIIVGFSILYSTINPNSDRHTDAATENILVYSLVTKFPMKSWRLGNKNIAVISNILIHRIIF